MQVTTLREEMEFLPEDRRKRIEEVADALIAEEMTLRDLRKGENQTQARVAERLGINQENVSRIEQRSDLLLSTLSGYVEAMGGKLNLVRGVSGPPADHAYRNSGSRRVGFAP